MNTLIVYFSITGNTEKLAVYLSEMLKDKGLQFDLKKTDQVDDSELNKYDTFFIGSPCYFYDLTNPIKKLLTNLSGLENKKLFMFVTHATDVTESSYAVWAAGCEKSYNDIFKNNQHENLGFYHCKGKPHKLIESFIKSQVFKDNKPGWHEFKQDMKNHPNNTDLDQFGTTIINVVEKNY